MMTTAVSSVGFEAFSGHSGFVLSQVRHKPDRQLPAGISAATGPDAATMIQALRAVSTELLTDKLVETLMATVLQHAGAERGLLILHRGDEARVEAEATTQQDAIVVRLRGTPAESSDLPETVLAVVLRTRQALMINDAAVSSTFSADDYVAAHRVRSLLCLPLVKQGTLVGALYLENTIASHVFTPSRIELLALLASQAAISLENARLYSDLREAQAYLAEAQRLSTTGSFGWKPASGEIVWSEETHRIFDLDRDTKPTLEFVVSRVHPEDRESVQRLIDRAAHEGKDCDLEHRLLMPDGAVKHLHIVAHSVHDEATGGTEYVGAVMDVTAANESRQALERAC